jgi:hypothetical protein
MSEITFSPPGRNALLGLGRVVGVCRSTISLLLGAVLAAVFGFGVVAGIGGAMVGSSPDDAAAWRLFSNHGATLAGVLHRLIQDAQPAAAPDRSRVARGARGMQPDKPSLSGGDRSETTHTAGRLIAFVVSAAGFYGAYRSGGGLEKWWNGKGKFPLAPKGKGALEFTGWALLALVVGLIGVGLIGSAAGILTGNDAALAATGKVEGFTRIPATVESQRSDALTSFCIGLALTGGSAVFMGWVFYKIVKGLRSLFRPAQSTGTGQ